MKTDQEAYDKLSLYTLAHASPEFIHQYAVDAYAAQHADEHSKPVYLAFALAGLYLHLEKGFSGKAVQLAHMEMGKAKMKWPVFGLPIERGSMNVSDVLVAAPGKDRDEAIAKWSASVWEAYSASHAKVAEWVQTFDLSGVAVDMNFK